MKAEVKVIELSHDDLVNILSTALYGSPNFQFNNDEDFYKQYKKTAVDSNDCIEDKAAKVLLSGGLIKIVDLYAEGEVYGNKGYLITGDNDEDWEENDYGDEDCSAEYILSLKDFIEGCSTPEGYEYAKELLIDEEGDFYTANSLLQIIMFGEEVY